MNVTMSFDYSSLPRLSTFEISIPRHASPVPLRTELVNRLTTKLVVNRLTSPVYFEHNQPIFDVGSTNIENRLVTV